MGAILANGVILGAFVTAIGGLILFAWSKWDEATTIKTAILAEIERLLNVLERHSKIWEERHEKAEHFSLIPFSHAVYDEQVKNVGRMNRDLVGRVVQFYGEIGFLNDFQKCCKEYEAAGNLEIFNRTYLKKIEDILAKFKESFKEEIDKANIDSNRKQPAGLYARFIRAWIGDGIRKWKKPIITKS